MQFSKYHALGNDYLVIDAKNMSKALTPALIRWICDRHYGVGSDGLLVWEAPNMLGKFRVRIFNPDGTEAEKSGNGFRIFARYLWDQKAVGDVPFQVWTLGGVVTCCVLAAGRAVTVEMGQVRFRSEAIPVTGPSREVLRESMLVQGQMLEYSAATIGNPHCVILRDQVSADEGRQFGPHIETDARFPNRVNVQFMQVLDRQNIRIEIWERGAGYTLASGSSGCAAAAVARRLGLCDATVTVHTPGGQLQVALGDDFMVQMTGPVVKVAEGVMVTEGFQELFARLR